jgi:adenylate cyclase
MGGSGDITDLEQLRAPMNDVFSGLAEQLKELQRYKARFGELDDEDEDEKRGVA